jgi:glycosyltransferase involved in cell wall biosynthesis
MTRRIRLTVAMTHPIQYYSPWFRFIAREADEIQLNVLYVTEPSAEQQGVGFEEPFDWDVPLKEGYESLVLRPSRESDRFASYSFLGLDAPGIGREIAKLEPDAVLLSGWHSLALVRAILACRRRGIPLLYRGDTHVQGLERDVLWRWRSRWLLSLFDRFLCVGRKAREYLDRLGVPSRHVFPSPHAVDNEFFETRAAPFLEPRARAEARREWGIAPDEFVVLFVGKLDPNKRPFDLLRAARSSSGGARILVAGSGPLRQECTELASQLQVSADFRGFLNQSQLPRAYALSDSLALPSERESWGLVVNEAMAAGTPAVVSEGVGCAPDLVEPGETGEIFPVGDVAAFAARLDRIAGEIKDGRSRSERCRRRIADYTFHAATEGLVSACKSVIP